MPVPPATRFKAPLGYPSVGLDFSSSPAVVWLLNSPTAGRSENAKLLFLFENYALDTDRRELCHGAVTVPVEPQVFDLLAHLIKNRDRVVSKDDLVAAVWGGRIISESALTTRINAAWCAIGDSGAEQRLIKTLTRKGVRFVGAVREEAKPEEVTRVGAGEGTAQHPKTELPLPDKPSIAVLPFANLSGNPEEDYFADGMAEEIITALSRCASLFVIARNSSFTYKGKAVDVRQVGRELGVRYVLEGSVRRAGNRLRFTGQLIDTSSGAHIWADRFEGTTSDVCHPRDPLWAGNRPAQPVAGMSNLFHDVAHVLRRQIVGGAPVGIQRPQQFRTESICVCFCIHRSAHSQCAKAKDPYG
jgi:TolB-like protein